MPERMTDEELRELADLLKRFCEEMDQFELLRVETSRWGFVYIAISAVLDDGVDPEVFVPI
jgi:hypothetical protein